MVRRVHSPIPAILLLAGFLAPGRLADAASGGDLDGDFHIGPADLFLFAPAWRTSLDGPGFIPDADLDEDGSVDQQDLHQLIRRWHTALPTPTPPPPSAAIVWERFSGGERQIVSRSVSDGETIVLISETSFLPSVDLGRRFLFFLDENETVFRATPAGTGRVSLGFRAEGGGARPSFDAGRLVYSVSVGFQQFDLWIRDSDGANPRRIGGNVNEYWLFPSFGPDGRVAFRRSSTINSSIDGIWVIDPDSGDPPIQYVRMRAAQNPRWSPDGTRIAFDDQESIYVMDAVPMSSPAKVVSPGANTRLGNWSPDGNYLVFDSNAPSLGSGLDLFIVSAAGGTPANLTNDGSAALDRLPDW